MSNFIGVYANIASPDYCDRMINAFEDLVMSGSGNSFGEEQSAGTWERKDINRFFERDAPELTRETNKILDFGLNLYKEEYPALSMRNIYSNMCKVQKTFPKGGFHVWHSEQGSHESAAARCLAWMIYLNDTPDGEGTTEFLEQGVRLQPKRGTVVFFPASWTHTHRGNPTYTGVKYIATGWYYLA